MGKEKSLENAQTPNAAYVALWTLSFAIFLV